MSLKDIACKAGKFIVKNGHWFLTGIGVTAIGIGTVDLVKTVQSDKFKKLIETSKNIIADVDRDENGKATSTKELIGAYAKSAGKTIQAYARPVALIAGGTSCIVAAVFVQSHRVKQLAALYTTTVAAYEAYRARVREEVGEEKEFDLYNDIKRDENGKVVSVNGKTAEELKGFRGSECVNKFSRLIGKGRCGLYDDNGRMMYQLLHNAEEQVRALLHQRAAESSDGCGVVYLNEIYDIFELHKSDEGMKYAYRWDPNDPTTDPNFRIVENALGDKLDEFKGAWKQELWLDFPCNWYVDHPYKPEVFHTEAEKERILLNRRKINLNNPSDETHNGFQLSHDILNEIDIEEGKV